jgi:hypothetical protein
LRLGRTCYIGDSDPAVLHLALPRCLIYYAWLVMTSRYESLQPTTAELDDPYYFFRQVTVKPGVFPKHNGLIGNLGTLSDDAARQSLTIRQCTQYPGLGRELVYTGDGDVRPGGVFGKLFGSWRRQKPTKKNTIYWTVKEGGRDLYLIAHRSCSLRIANDACFGVVSKNESPNAEVFNDESQPLWSPTRLVMKVSP